MNPTHWDWAALVRGELDRLEQSHLYRHRQVVRPLDATHVEVAGRRLVNFASNDYLGLTHHPRVIRAATEAAAEAGVGSGAAPLISGHTRYHAAAERRIAGWKGTESAVLLGSGYLANLAAVQTIAAVAERSGRPVRFLLDKLVHASLIDAVRGSGAPFRVFPHNGLSKLDRLLSDAPAGEVQVVVTESVFSMDGDTADLSGLADLKRRRPFILLLDEAHGSGVFGPSGAGLAAELGLQDTVDVSVVTLSKAVGCGGGAVCGGEDFCNALVNFGRAYVYSTSLPVPVAAAIDAAVAVLADEPWRQQRLRELVRRVRTELGNPLEPGSGSGLSAGATASAVATECADRPSAGQDGFVSEVEHVTAEAVAPAVGGRSPLQHAGLGSFGASVPAGDSPIIPVILGTETAALGAAEALREQGLWVLAVRPPTVPRGSSRLRVTLSSEHTDDEVRELVRAVRAIRRPSD